jgi:hypothetical protein
MSIQQQLQELLIATEQQFNRSRIKAAAEQAGKKWMYNIAATRITPQNPLILGFNWGAEEKERYTPVLEDKTFLNSLNANDLGSMKRLRRHLVQYLHMDDDAMENVGQSNYCFFRSKSDGEIVKSDLELCRPLFEKLLEIARPSMILSFSNRLRDYLLGENRVSDVMRQPVPTENPSKRNYRACKGFLEVHGSTIPIYFLPHPNYRLSGVARDAAWEFCFGRRAQS